MKRESLLFVAFSIGRWTQKTCSLLLSKVRSRVKKPGKNDRVSFFSDGNDDYAYVLPRLYRLNNVNYGQLVKIRVKGRVVDKIKRTVYGSIPDKKIETTFVEGFNSIIRERVGRLVRKTKCTSWSNCSLARALELFQFYWNFMDPIKCKSTPGMIEGLTDHVWTWNDFLIYNNAV